MARVCVKLFILAMITVAKRTNLPPTMIIRLIRDEWKRGPRGREKKNYM